MATVEKRDHLVPITPIVTNGVCFMCQRVSRDYSSVRAAKARMEINQRLKKYINVQVSEGSLCKDCLKSMETVVTKVDDLRDGILVDKAGSHSNLNLTKVGASTSTFCASVVVHQMSPS